MACACVKAGKPKCAWCKEAEKMGGLPRVTVANGETVPSPGSSHRHLRAA